jgi:hypothetical protein
MPVITTRREALAPLPPAGRGQDMRVTIIERVDSPGERLPWSWLAFAWGGALMFALSLIYFLFTYAFTFGEGRPAAAPRTAIVRDLALFTVFALHHSLFARRRVRAWVTRTVPRPLERSFYVWVASLLFIAVCAFWEPVAGVAWAIARPFGWLLYASLAGGVWLSVRSASVIDVWDLAGVRQASTPNSQPLQRTTPEERSASRPATIGSPASEDVGNWEFKTSGPYGFVRHPIYLGWFLMMFGLPTMTNTRLLFALVSCTYLLIAIPLEERTLDRASAGKYDNYMKAVRWRLVPGVY